MKLFNQLLNDNFDIFDKLSLILFSILPISFIIGNAFININIFIIDLLFLTYCFKHNLWTWIKKDIFIYLILLYAFLVFNSFYSYFFLIEDQVSGLLRSVLFIKFILLVYAFKTLIKKDEVLDLINKFWIVIISIIIFDVLFEKAFGKNIIGNISPDGTRIVSFFKDELIVGTFIFCFGFTSITYFLNKNNNKSSKIIFTILLLLIPLAIFLSGERSNFIKSAFLYLIILIFIKKNKIYFSSKTLIIIFFSLATLFLFFNKYTYIKYTEFFKRVQVVENTNVFMEKFQNIKYFAHYETALKIFKNYPVLGVGNKNFRYECAKEKYYDENIKFSEMRCSTHPHQIHFEILSEQGILGYLIIAYLILRFTLKNFKIYRKKKNINHLSNLSYLLLFFIPLLPGSGIFSTFNGSIFWIIFSLTNLEYEKNK